ncbi:hypothetical protein DPMN_141559 [Dreissena polymorpha]|uniref:Uncharacterized protein n=1 Tax=Dreissena polymorpha TaxID=45954 RepID=A0A9D4JK09_DREPO|nr:hypothetical protein DPMN_141559 [Dreissena polymorpha]
MDNGSPCRVVIDGFSRSGDPYGDEGSLNIDDLEADDIVKLTLSGYAIHTLNT